MAYEEFKKEYNKYKKVPSDAKLVSHEPLTDWKHAQRLWDSCSSFIKGKPTVDKLTEQASFMTLLRLFLTPVLLRYSSDCVNRMHWNTSPWQHYPKYLLWPRRTHIRWWGLAYKTSTTDMMEFWMSWDGRGGMVLIQTCFSILLEYGVNLSPSLQEWRCHWFLQRHHPQCDTCHSRVLHHLCSLWKRVQLPAAAARVRPPAAVWTGEKPRSSHWDTADWDRAPRSRPDARRVQRNRKRSRASLLDFRREVMDQLKVSCSAQLSLSKLT